ncbi:MAG: hypothetical protein JNK30_20600 [Phenylobacterium sp.]|uniref:hypothetical protein n=1 Tax=Phenylobacterium sp. TaxID=1871053 RepID=UPI001A3BAA9A|nr:hypothetical protein [Phenylobacterium sp.]MBL8773798.1 hypothetical protein [Phenylobacterium sp.]
MRRLVPIALGCALCLPPPAVAQPADPARDDLRCMVIMTMFAARTEDPALRQGAVTGFGYYMGRLKGRDPSIEVKPRLIDEARGMMADAERVKAEAARCGGDMQVWGRETKEIGDALQAEGRRGPGAPQPR